MTISQNLKLQIKANLDALVTAGYLGSYISMDSGKDPITIDPPGAYPFAMVSMPQISSEWEDQATNKRTYRWDILFIQKAENVTDGSIEANIDEVLNQFDNNFTLAGVAQGAVLPAEVLAWPVSSGDKSYVCFVVTLKARALYLVDEANVNVLVFVDNESVSADGDGYNFTLANIPIPGSVHLYAQGVRLTVANEDYSIDGATITTSDPWSEGDLTADYRIYE